MTINKILKSIILSCLFFVVSALLATSAHAAPRLFFDPSSYTSNRDSDFQIKIQIDVESQSAFGADATITFPSADITVKSVTNGGFFSDFSSAQSTGRLEIHGYFSASYDSKSGSGTFATLTLSSNKESGSGSVSFTCTGGGNDTQILNSSGNNILSCGSLNLLSINYAGTSSNNTGGTGSSDSTIGEPNSCGGTCGSNYNCKAGFFCYQGYCRTPLCKDDADCDCVTPKPKATPKATVKPSPTMEVIYLSPDAPSPAPGIATATAQASPEAALIGEGKQKLNLFLYFAGGAFGLALILLIANKLIRK